VSDNFDFPYVVIQALLPILAAVEGVDVALGRELSSADPTFSVGLWALEWTPTGYEIGQEMGPSLTTYHYGFEVLLKHSDAEEGHMLHSELSSRIRRVLSGSDDVRTALGAINIASGFPERVLRWNVTRQAFASSEIGRQMVFLSAGNFDVDTELI
jgi:hypothetical protein